MKIRIIFPKRFFSKEQLGTLKNTARIVTETILSVIERNPINVVN